MNERKRREVSHAFFLFAVSMQGIVIGVSAGMYLSYTGLWAASVLAQVFLWGMFLGGVLVFLFAAAFRTNVHEVALRE
jgi:hypothetical protein